MRINKFMATCGVASRRKCDELIESGHVKVNANVCTKLGLQIDPEVDLVTVDDRPIRLTEQYVYYMLNKPCNVVTTVSDPNGRPTVMEYVPSDKHRIFPVGRLDYNTSGLLLFTNDGDVAQKLIHPSFEFGKTYIAEVKGVLDSASLNNLRKGVDIGGFVTSPAVVEVVETKQNRTTVKIVIHEGKNRQVRRMFEAVGSRVLKLQRVAVGKIELGDLPVGKYRALTKEEVAYIKSA